VTSLHPGVTCDQVRQNTGWQVRFAGSVTYTEPPSVLELNTLRELNARTARAHGAAPVEATGARSAR
jgi:glutaconate CoA-transferase subunit B